MENVLLSALPELGVMPFIIFICEYSVRSLLAVLWIIVIEEICCLLFFMEWLAQFWIKTTCVFT